MLQLQLNVLEATVSCAEKSSQKFDESKVRRGAGGKFGNKPESAPASKTTPVKPQIPPEVLEKQRQLKDRKDRVEEITKMVRGTTFGQEAIARLQSLSSSFKKSLDSNKIFRHAQIAMQGLQSEDSLEKVLGSAISQYKNVLEGIKKGMRAEEVAGIVSATSSVIGSIVGSLYGREALKKVSEFFKQEQVSLNLEDIAGKGKPLGHLQDALGVVESLRQGAIDTINIIKRLM